MVQKEISLSERELKRHGVLERLRAGVLRQTDAARELGLSTRQVRRLLRRLESAGPEGLRSARRGRKPDNWIDTERRGVDMQCAARNCSMVCDRVNSTYICRLQASTMTKKDSRRRVLPTTIAPYSP